MVAAPSGPRMACGVSTWTSKYSRCWWLSQYAASSRSHSTAIADTWAADVTWGSVIRKPGGTGRPCSSSAPRNTLSVLTARCLVAFSRLLHRTPVNGGAGAPRREGADAPRGRAGMGVLGVVGPAAVAVLEVDPQVLDRRSGE